MWSVSRSDAAYYRIDPSRGHQVIVTLLQGFSGVLVVDGYAAYGTAARALGSAVRVATCWAHARRALLEAEVSYREATQPIALIGEMFLVERDLPSWSSITDERLRAQALAQIREMLEAITRPRSEHGPVLRARRRRRRDAGATPAPTPPSEQEDAERCWDVQKRSSELLRSRQTCVRDEG